MRSNASMSAAPALKPLDVRVMNGAAALLGLVFVLMLVSFGLRWAVNRPAFSLHAIEVESELVHNNAITLRANVAHKLAGNFFTVDLTQTRAAFEAVPWVRSAVVRREFPDRLRVQLQEHEAAAFWGPEEDSRLVNTYGEIFEANQADLEVDDLPLLNGPASQSSLVLQGYRLLSPVFGQLDVTLSNLELTGRGSWRARLDGGAVVEMGPGTLDELHARVQRFVSTVTQVSARFGRDLESADLRYPNGYALKLRGVTTTSVSEKQDKKTR